MLVLVTVSRCYNLGIKCKTDKRIIGNTTYMEVSGVDNEETRREAAHAVGDVLRQGGKYLLLFIVTLDAGRVRPDDINLVSLVLDQNKDINCYGVIFNKITDGILRELNEDPNNRNIVITQLTNTGGERPVPLPLFLHRDERLEDANKVVVEIPSLEKFISMVPLLDARVRAGNYPVEN